MAMYMEENHDKIMMILLYKALIAGSIVAAFIHHENGTDPPFVVSPLYEAEHYIVQPTALGCSDGLLGAIDETPPGLVITSSFGGFNSAVVASRV